MRNGSKILSRIALALSTLSLFACSTIKVRDYVMYGDKGIHGATGVHSLCPLEKCPPELLNKTQWDARRLGMVCVDAVVMAEIQANVDKLCAKNPRQCEYEKVATTRRNIRQMLRSQQWAGVKIRKDIIAMFEPERDNELFEAMMQSFVQENRGN